MSEGRTEAATYKIEEDILSPEEKFERAMVIEIKALLRNIERHVARTYE